MLCATVICMPPVAWIFVAFVLAALARINKPVGYLLMLSLVCLCILDGKRGGLLIAFAILPSVILVFSVGRRFGS